METSKITKLYTQLKEELNSEQQKNLFELIREYEEDEMKTAESSFCDGAKHGLKTALKLIIDAI